MKSYFNSCVFGALVLAGVGYGSAQNPAPGSFRHGGNMDFMAHEMGSRLVTGTPFTAQAATQTTQTLPNGTHISRNTTATLYRDSQGRTRREEMLGARARSHRPAAPPGKWCLFMTLWPPPRTL